MEHESGHVVRHDGEVALGVAGAGPADEVERPGVCDVGPDRVEPAERGSPGRFSVEGVAGEGHCAILAEGAEHEAAERCSNPLRCGLDVGARSGGHLQLALDAALGDALDQRLPSGETLLGAPGRDLGPPVHGVVGQPAQSLVGDDLQTCVEQL